MNMHAATSELPRNRARGSIKKTSPDAELIVLCRKGIKLADKGKQASDAFHDAKEAAKNKYPERPKIRGCKDCVDYRKFVSTSDIQKIMREDKGSRGPDWKKSMQELISACRVWDAECKKIDVAHRVGYLRGLHNRYNYLLEDLMRNIAQRQARSVEGLSYKASFIEHSLLYSYDTQPTFAELLASLLLDARMLNSVGDVSDLTGSLSLTCGGPRYQDQPRAEQPMLTAAE